MSRRIISSSMPSEMVEELVIYRNAARTNQCRRDRRFTMPGTRPLRYCILPPEGDEAHDLDGQ